MLFTRKTSPFARGSQATGRRMLRTIGCAGYSRKHGAILEHAICGFSPSLRVMVRQLVPIGRDAGSGLSLTARRKAVEPGDLPQYLANSRSCM